MLTFSRTTGYAVLALTYMHEHEGRWLLSHDIASHTVIPRPYLSKILHNLEKSGLIRAKRGYRGGYRLARPAEQISVLEVVEAIDGPEWRNQCILGVGSCPACQLCPTYKLWKAEIAKIERELGLLTLAARSQMCSLAQAQGVCPKNAKCRGERRD
jgi:Rrf2 family protein